MNLDDTQAFVAVARAASFTQAGQRLGVPKGTVSRQVARLEQRLGARLLQRTTRRVSLTNVGRAYYEQCLHAIEALENAERLVTDASGKATGTLRVSAPFDFARDWLAGCLPELHRRHPALRLEIEASQRRVDLLAENFDVVIRAGAGLPDSALVARKLIPSGLVFCATPGYLKKHGRPREIGDLADHQCLVIQRSGGPPRWQLDGPVGPIEVDLRGWLVANEWGVLREAVIAGLGIGLLETNLAQRDFATGRLKRVLRGYGSAAGGLWIVYPSRLQLSSSVRAFVDFVAEKLARRGRGRG